VNDIRRVQVMQPLQDLDDVASDERFVEFPKRFEGLA
jgi:hypothetical protein